VKEKWSKNHTEYGEAENDEQEEVF
jgi:hypothetical protein